MHRRLLGSLVTVGLLALGMACAGKKSKTPTAPLPAAPACSLSVSSLAFGFVIVDSSTERNLAVTNIGGGTLSGSVTTNSTGYTVVSGGSFNLTAGQQGIAVIRFTPPTTGSLPGTINVTGGCGNVSCSGAGQASGPLCAISTTSLDFGSVPLNVCGFSDRIFVVSNQGTGTLAGGVSSACPSFQVLGSASYSLGPGQRDTVSVRYVPSGFGAQLCAISTGCDTVRCVGHGVAPQGCASLSPTTIDFGTAYVGQTVTRNVALSGVGAQFDLAWASDGEPDFVGPPGQGAIQPDDIITFPIHFTPMSAGPHSSYFQGRCLLAIGDGQYDAFACVTVTGTGVVAAGSPSCQLSSSSLDFGTVAVGNSRDLTVSITNTGGGVLNGIVANCDPFAVVGDPTISLGPGQVKMLTIRFTPTQHGHAESCYLHLADPVCSQLYVSGQDQ